MFATDDVPPGFVFCLRGDDLPATPNYPLAPHYAVHVSFDGATIILPHTRTRPILDLMKGACAREASVDTNAIAAFDRLTKHGKEMSAVTRALAAATKAVSGVTQQQKAAGLFAAGANAAATPETRRKNATGDADAGFEVLAFLAVLPQETVA